MKLYLAIFATTLSLLLLANVTQAEVSIQAAGQVLQPGVYSLPEGARLQDASRAAQVKSSAWFLGGALLRKSHVEPQQRLKAGLIFELKSSAVHARAVGDNKTAELITQLLADVEAMHVTGRAVAEMNPLQQRFVRHNPELESGDRLIYPARPSHVRILGAVTRTCELAHNPAWQLGDYIEACSRHPSADPSFAYVIQPNGTWALYGVAPWNEEKPSIAVGAVLFVPLDESRLAPSTDNFNQDMAAMLATQYRLGGLFSE